MLSQTQSFWIVGALVRGVAFWIVGLEEARGARWSPRPCVSRVETGGSRRLVTMDGMADSRCCHSLRRRRGLLARRVVAVPSQAQSFWIVAARVRGGGEHSGHWAMRSCVETGGSHRLVTMDGMADRRCCRSLRWRRRGRRRQGADGGRCGGRHTEDMAMDVPCHSGHHA